MPTINGKWFKERLAVLKMSQRQFAKKLKMDPSGITNLFQGKRAMSLEEAQQIAEILLVPVTEVMRQAGIDVVDDVRKVPIAGYVGAGAVVTLLPRGTHDQVVAPADVPVGSIALQQRVIGNPVDGWLLYIDGQHQPPEHLLDRFCLVALADGRMVAAIIKRGYKQRLYNLMLMPERAVLENQELAWASRVLWIQPT